MEEPIYINEGGRVVFLDCEEADKVIIYRCQRERDVVFELTDSSTPALQDGQFADFLASQLMERGVDGLYLFKAYLGDELVKRGFIRFEND